MLEQYFSATHTLHRLRAGPTGPFIDGFAEALGSAGYVRSTVRDHVDVVAHLGAWLRQASVRIQDVEEATITEFFGHVPTCRCQGLPRPPGRRHRASAAPSLFLEHLRCEGVAPRRDDEVCLEPELIRGFESWMLHHRGVTESTFAVYRPIVIALLKTLGEEPDRFTAEGLRAFILNQAGRCGDSYAKLIVTAVRGFLRFLSARGRCSVDLIGTIPTVAHWRRSSLPRHLPNESVERILESCDLATARGVRDRAVLLLLSRLGLRAIDVANLRITDIDWSQARLRVMGKERRESWLPLPQDVGDAIIAYLQDARPAVREERVFLRLLAPIRPFTNPTAVSHIVDRAIQRAGIDAPGHGAHVLRHSAAAEMLHHGASLGSIGAILRHRSVETTAIYTKIDVASLRLVVQPWPEEVSPC